MEPSVRAGQNTGMLFYKERERERGERGREHPYIHDCTHTVQPCVHTQHIRALLGSEVCLVQCLEWDKGRHLLSSYCVVPRLVLGTYTRRRATTRAR